VLPPVVQHRNRYVSFSISTSRSLPEVFTIREVGVEAELDRLSIFVGRVAIPRSDDINVERVEVDMLNATYLSRCCTTGGSTHRCLRNSGERLVVS